MFGEKDAQWCEVHLIYVHYLLKVLFKKNKKNKNCILNIFITMSY